MQVYPLYSATVPFHIIILNSFLRIKEKHTLKLSKIIIFLKTYVERKRLYKLSIRNPKKFRSWQKKRHKQHLAKIVNYSVYYKEVVEKYGVFPVIDKSILMENFDNLNTVGISFENARSTALLAEQSRDFSPKIGTVSVGLSSGTTGNQGIFLVSNKEITQWSAAVIAKLIDFTKFRKNKINIAFFMRANNNLYESINNSKMSIHFFDLLTPIEKNLTDLDKTSPNVIVAQPSMLRLIAQHYEQYNRDYEIKEIYSIAEVLDPIDEEYISQVMGMPVKQVYQATEGFLATTCQHGKLHLNEDIIYVEKEYIDKDSRRFVPIITDLYRISQPLVRYRLNDVLVEAIEPCPCGSCFTTLETIEGREDDCFILTNITGQKITLFADFIRYAIIKADERITEYRAIQNSNGSIEIQLNLNPYYFSEIKEKILKNFIDLFYQFEIEDFMMYFNNTIELTKNGKMRRIERIKK
ncbi:adenylate cyclase [Listeria monocytogenes]|nr:adenylate cyclase [Listeria monocytogenes]EAE1481888.1 adenylate cyclase [Listeria monocytogenes]EAF5217242.1 adenylate cyclase [Listeria monocytogenes]EAG1934352.1 adenylate cyclase [Listeria monocytogenes]EAH4075400.1 adenylate cyclase [Listeria monocytogenes]